jgi:hypothetical protein
MLDALRAGLATVGASDQLSLWARDGLYVSSFDQTLTFQSLAKWALANTNYYTNLTHAPGIVTNHAPL